jgi:ATP-binding cassette subfamily C (CFTR/MRP) protein 4
MEDRQQTDINKSRKKHPREKTNLLSHILFCWELPIFFKSLRKKLSEDDFHGPLKQHKSAMLGDKLEAAWEAEKATHKDPSFWRVLIKTFYLEFIVYGFIHFLSELALLICQPFCLGKLLDYFSQPETTITRDQAYVYAAVFVLLAALYVITFNWMILEETVLGMKVRVACGSLLYRHALKQTKSNLSKTTVGQTINLFANDLKRFEGLFTFLPFVLFITPIELIVSIYIFDVGYSHAALTAVAALVLIALGMYLLSRKISTYRMKIAVNTDSRVRLMDGIINGIQVIKMYTWEKPFGKLIQLIRETEIFHITTISHFRISIVSVKAFIHRLTVFSYLLVAILSGLSTTAQHVFPLATAFEILKVSTIVVLPRALVNFAETKITVRRIQEFLLSGHKFDRNSRQRSLLPSGSIPNTLSTSEGCTKQTPPGIAAKNISVKWDQSSSICNLHNISFDVSPGELIAVIGPTGSGKTTLLQTILKEIPLLKGSLDVEGTTSYSSQEAWIFNSTIRQNILFGEEMDDEKYQKVVKVCALEHDFALFPYGDSTVVGEKGAMLSGGQKARVNLARAVYRDADIYLLDDPLAAVDPQVARHLFDECIAGYLKDKCVVLVTHQIQLLRKAKYIYFLEKGKLIAQGLYEDLANNPRQNLFELIKVENEDNKLDVLTAGTEITSSKKLLTSQQLQKDKIGNVNVKKSYQKYFIINGNWLSTLGLMSLFVLLQVIAVFADYVIIFWVDLVQEQKNSNSSTTNRVSNTNDYIDSHKGALEKLFTIDNFLYIYAIIIVLMIVVTEIRSWVFVKFSVHASRVLHNNMFQQIVNGKMKFFNTHQSGQILNRFSKDIGMIDEILPSLLMDAIQIFFSLFGVFLLISILDYWFTIAMVVLIVIFGCYVFVMLPVSQVTNELEGSTRGPVVSHLASSLQGLITIRAFNAQRVLTREFDKYQDRHSSIFYMNLTLHGAVRFWVDLTCTVYIAVVTFRFFLHQDFPVSYIGLVIMQSTVTTGMSSFFMKNFCDVANNMKSVERVLEYSENIAEEDTGTEKLREQWPSEGKVEFQSVSLRYSPEEPPVLKVISFTVQPREKIGIIGRTGAGKSSLLSVLFHLFPFDGKVVVDGVDTKTLPLSKVRSAISIVPQNPVLFSETLRKNLDPFGEYSDDAIWAALDDVELKDTIAALPAGLETMVTDGASNFSVGQKQLLCLVRAILRNSKIIVLDEATANVDLKSDELIQSTIRKRFKDCTILTIAHRLLTVMDADKILIMDAGKVIEFDHPYNLLKNSNGFFYEYIHKGGKNMAEKLMSMAEKNYLQKAA